MTPLDIFLIFAAAAIAILTAVLVPALLQLKKTSHRMENSLEMLERELVPACRKVAAAAGEVELLAATCNAKCEEADVVLRTARQASETLLLTSQALKDSVRPVISGIGGLSAGLLTFGRVLRGGKKL